MYVALGLLLTVFCVTFTLEDESAGHNKFNMLREDEKRMKDVHRTNCLELAIDSKDMKDSPFRPRELVYPIVYSPLIVVNKKNILEKQSFQTTFHEVPNLEQTIKRLPRSEPSFNLAKKSVKVTGSTQPHLNFDGNGIAKEKRKRKRDQMKTEIVVSEPKIKIKLDQKNERNTIAVDMQPVPSHDAQLENIAKCIDNKLFPEPSLSLGRSKNSSGMTTEPGKPYQINIEKVIENSNSAKLLDKKTNNKDVKSCKSGFTDDFTEMEPEEQACDFRKNGLLTESMSEEKNEPTEEYGDDDFGYFDLDEDIDNIITLKNHDCCCTNDFQYGDGMETEKRTPRDTTDNSLELTLHVYTDGNEVSRTENGCDCDKDVEKSTTSSGFENVLHNEALNNFRKRGKTKTNRGHHPQRAMSGKKTRKMLRKLKHTYRKKKRKRKKGFKNKTSKESWTWESDFDEERFLSSSEMSATDGHHQCNCGEEYIGTDSDNNYIEISAEIIGDDSSYSTNGAMDTTEHSWEADKTAHAVLRDHSSAQPATKSEDPLTASSSDEGVQNNLTLHGKDVNSNSWVLYNMLRLIDEKGELAKTPGKERNGVEVQNREDSTDDSVTLLINFEDDIIPQPNTPILDQNTFSKAVEELIDAVKMKMTGAFIGDTTSTTETAISVKTTRNRKQGNSTPTLEETSFYTSTTVPTGNDLHLLGNSIKSKSKANEHETIENKTTTHTTVNSHEEYAFIFPEDKENRKDWRVLLDQLLHQKSPKATTTSPSSHEPTYLLKPEHVPPVVDEDYEQIISTMEDTCSTVTTRRGQRPKVTIGHNGNHTLNTEYVYDIVKCLLNVTEPSTSHTKGGRTRSSTRTHNHSHADISTVTEEETFETIDTLPNHFTESSKIIPLKFHTVQPYYAFHTTCYALHPTAECTCYLARPYQVPPNTDFDSDSYSSRHPHTQHDIVESTESDHEHHHRPSYFYTRHEPERDNEIHLSTHPHTRHDVDEHTEYDHEYHHQPTHSHTTHEPERDNEIQWSTHSHTRHDVDEHTEPDHEYHHQPTHSHTRHEPERDNEIHLSTHLHTMQDIDKYTKSDHEFHQQPTHAQTIHEPERDKEICSNPGTIHEISEFTRNENEIDSSSVPFTRYDVFEDRNYEHDSHGTTKHLKVPQDSEDGHGPYPSTSSSLDSRTDTLGKTKCEKHHDSHDQLLTQEIHSSTEPVPGTSQPPPESTEEKINNVAHSHSEASDNNYTPRPCHCSDPRGENDGDNVETTTAEHGRHKTTKTTTVKTKGHPTTGKSSNTSSKKPRRKSKLYPPLSLYRIWPSPWTALQLRKGGQRMKEIPRLNELPLAFVVHPPPNESSGQRSFATGLNRLPYLGAFVLNNKFLPPGFYRLDDLRNLNYSIWSRDVPLFRSFGRSIKRNFLDDPKSNYDILPFMIRDKIKQKGLRKPRTFHKRHLNPGMPKIRIWGNNLVENRNHFKRSTSAIDKFENHYRKHVKQ